MAQFEVLPVRDEDTDEIMKLLERTFFIDEPLNKAIGLCDEGRCPELDEYCTHSLKEGLSFKAVDKEGNIVGVMISGSCPLKEDEDNNLLSQAQRCKNPKFQRILYILSRREEGSRLWEKFPDDDKMVEVKVVATDPEWRRKGIMNVLLKETEKAAIERDIRLLKMETSSAYSAMSAERLGFNCMYTAKYTDITLDGLPLIVPEPPHIDDSVYIKSLFDNKQGTHL